MRLPPLIALLLALVCAPVAGAQFERVPAQGGEWLELENGRGVAIVRSQDGTMLGRVARGTIRVVVPRSESDTDVGLYGCERRRNEGRARICAGRQLRFAVVGGAWRVTARGAGIHGSASLRGSVTLRGRAGTYSIDRGDERPWPRRARTFSLG